MYTKGTRMNQLSNKERTTLRKLIQKFNATKDNSPTTFSQFDFSKWVLQNYEGMFDKNILKAFYSFELQRKKKRDIEYNKNFVRKSLRFTHDDWKKIERQLESANIDFTTFAKNALLKNKIKFPIVQTYLFEVNRIGNNLNQIARSLNSGDELNISILSTLISIEKELRNLHYDR
jgi:hypothetical protein